MFWFVFVGPASQAKGLSYGWSCTTGKQSWGYKEISRVARQKKPHKHVQISRCIVYKHIHKKRNNQVNTLGICQYKTFTSHGMSDWDTSTSWNHIFNRSRLITMMFNWNRPEPFWPSLIIHDVPCYHRRRAIEFWHIINHFLWIDVKPIICVLQTWRGVHS